MKKKSPLQAILLITLLGILPVGSWIYMKKGFNYQKAAMAELKDYGKLAPFLAKDIFSRDIGSDEIKDNLILLNYYSTDAAANERMELVEKLHEQFDDREGVLFVNIGMAENAVLEKEYSTLDTNQVYFIPASDRAPFFLGREILMPTNAQVEQQDSLIFQPIDASSLQDFNYFVLVDPKGKIRNYYPADEPRRIKRLVEHIALTMPRKKKAKTESIPKNM